MGRGINERAGPLRARPLICVAPRGPPPPHVTDCVYTPLMNTTPSTPPMRVVFLGSGSSGNATAVAFGGQVLLIDCGFSAREVAKRLESVGLSADSVAAIVLTHEHSDHVRGVEVFARRHGCPVFATRGTAFASGLDGRVAELKALRRGEQVRIASFGVLPFATSHDASEPVGYRVEVGGSAFGLASDTGVLTPEAAEALADVDVLGIESNHDVEMLERGPYPPFLKRRILSADGHLSNPDAADALERLVCDRLRCVVGVHRSNTNNTARLAQTALASRLAALGHPASVSVAAQATCLEADL